MQVITYQTASGDKVNLTEHHVTELQRAGTWPRNARGEEYCRVSHGWHEGYPSYSGVEIARMVCDALNGRRACQALTTKGTRCRNEAVAYLSVSRECEAALCAEHQHAHYVGTLRLA